MKRDLMRVLEVWKIHPLRKPVEVKVGLRGRLKSIILFLESHPNSTMALKISEKDYERNALTQNIPFYAIKAWLEDVASIV